MKNLLIKVLSALCALAMLFALLPAAIAEEGGEAPQEIPAAEETVLPEEPAADEPAEESAPAEDPAPVEAPAPIVDDAPAVEDVPVVEAASVEESAPAEEAGSAEDTGSAEEAAPADENASTEEAASAEEGVSAEETASAEESASVGENAPADEAAVEEVIPAEEPAEEIVTVEEADAGEEAEEEAEEETEEGSEEENVEAEPVKLIVGNTLSDTVQAGREYKIELKATQTGSAMLTLILNRGQAMNVRIEGNEAEFTEVETGDPARIYFIHEMNVTEWCDYSVILTAGEDTPFTLKSECAVVAAAPAAEEAKEESEDETEEETAEEPAAEEQADEETEEGEEVPVEEESVREEEEEQDRAAEEEMLNAGYVRVMVIRQNGTSLFAEQDEHAEAVGSLACGDIVWAKPAGNIWGEVYRGEDSEPLYLNLNNAALQLGEVGYDVPVRKVTLSSTLEGLTEIDEGSWVVINAEISGFTADEIAEITWQYRAAEDEEFCDIEDAHDFMYIYPISSENVHYEWRIVLTIKS